ncbi:MAG: DNA helicase RecQ [Ruminococcus sp.]
MRRVFIAFLKWVVIAIDKFSVLNEYFGHSEFRNGQSEIIDSILSGRDALGIMPTGAGKSVCYQIPAILMDGITLVISPLISLMKDQVNSLVQSGIKAAYINSSLTSAQYNEVIRRAGNNLYKIIYVAPERLSTESFMVLSESVKISMVTVDEAHCISQWGQDFRPDYRRIVDFVNKLPYRPIISAFTATATPEVRDDIVNILNLNNPYLITTGFDRENLYFGVVRPKNKYDELVRLICERRGRCGIVYCISRKKVEEVCERLNNDGFSATRYHAGLSESERHSNQDDFIYDRKQIMVATNAFGMGIDKSNVSFVIHYNMPKNLESYYQEAGRAGRDGEAADCILMYNPSDVRTNQFMIENSRESAEELSDDERVTIIERDRLRLKYMTIYCTTSSCLREYILKYFGDPAKNFCGKCSSCLNEFETVDITVEAQKIVSCVYRIHQKGPYFGKKMITDILRGSRDSRLLELGFDKLSTYGIMSDTSSSRIRAILDYLIGQEYLSADEKYQVITLNAKSAEILRSRPSLTMKLPKEDSRESRKKNEVDYFADSQLFNQLKRLRRTIADNEGIPAYIVFSDATLKDMCRKLPKNYSQFIGVSGVGMRKAEKYGEEFCKLIAKYTAENPNDSPAPGIRQSFVEDNLEAYRNNLSEAVPRRWSNKEDEKLRSEISCGMNMAQIAAAHNRKISEIMMRIKKL